jgi:hypothetical protein
MQIADLPPAKNSAARERLLETAARIFYAEGVNTVGVQRIVEELAERGEVAQAVAPADDAHERARHPDPPGARTAVGRRAPGEPGRDREQQAANSELEHGNRQLEHPRGGVATLRAGGSKRGDGRRSLRAASRAG